MPGAEDKAITVSPVATTTYTVTATTINQCMAMTTQLVTVTNPTVAVFGKVELRKVVTGATAGLAAGMPIGKPG